MKIIIDLHQCHISNLDYFKGCNYEFFIIKSKFNIDILIENIKQKGCKYTITDNICDGEYILFKNNFIPKLELNNYIYYCRASGKNCILEQNGISDFYYNHPISAHTQTIIQDTNILKIPKKAVFAPHWGWTDFIILTSMINYYNSIFEEVVLFIPEINVQDMLNILYPNNRKIYLDIVSGNPSAINIISSFIDEYIFLIDGHQSTQCLPMTMNQMNINENTINFHLLKNSAHNIGEGINKNIVSNFINIIKERDANESDFDERVYFYTYSYFNKEDICKYFTITRNKSLEDIQQQLVPRDYIVVHNVDTMKQIHSEYPIIYLNDRSNYILDLLSVIENSKEIHIYDSLYGTIIYLLYFSSNFIKSKPIYYHKYARSKIPKFYDIDMINSSNDWNIL